MLAVSTMTGKEYGWNQSITFNQSAPLIRIIRDTANTAA